MTKIAIKVTDLAYYDGGLVYPGTIIKNYEGEIPKWATLASGKEQKKETPVEPSKPTENENNNDNSETQNENETQVQTSVPEDQNNRSENQVQENEVIVAGEGGVHVIPQEKTEAQLMEELDNLITKAIEKNIVIEDADKKTIDEQIAELKSLLGEE